jgi:hypothetical protein
VLFFAADDWNLEKGQGVVFVLPVNAGAASLQPFVNAGAKPVEGHADTVSLNGTAFRRTANTFIFSPTEEAVVGVKDKELPNIYKKQPAAGAELPAQPIARIVFDEKALRTVASKAFESALAEIRKSSGKPKDDSERLGQDLALQFIKNIDRVELALGRATNNLELKLAIAPAQVPAAGTFDKPGMPAEVITRVDISAPPRKILAFSDESLRRFVRTIPIDPAGNRPNPQQQRQLIAFLNATADVLLDGDAASIGVATRADGATIYMVQQHPKPDLPGRLKAVVDQYKRTSEMMDSPGEQDSLNMETYAGPGGSQVTRIRMNDALKHTTFYVDALQQGDRVFLTGSDDAAHHLDDLMNAKEAGPMTSLVSGQVNLERALEAAFSASDSGFAKIPADRRKTLKEMVKGRSLSFTANGEKDSIAFSIGLPEELIKQSIDLLMGGGDK